MGEEEHVRREIEGERRLLARMSGNIAPGVQAAHPSWNATEVAEQSVLVARAILVELRR